MVLAKDINSLTLGGQTYSKTLAGKIFETKGNSNFTYGYINDGMDNHNLTPQGKITVEASTTDVDGNRFYIVHGNFYDSISKQTNSMQLYLSEEEFNQLIK